MKVAHPFMRACTLLIVLASTALMLGWTWNRCPEGVTDFGREIYLPWRIVSGDVLYRDLNHFNGPLSPYVNAVWFELLGTSLRTMKVANALITLAAAGLIYHLIQKISDRFTATLCGVAFATIFAASHLLAANFNFLTPYSHDLTHGLVLSLGMLAVLTCAHEARQRLRWYALGGFSFGLVLLTKAEVALAAGIGAATMLAIGFRDGGSRHGIRASATFLAAAIVPPAVAVFLLSRAMPLAQAASGAAGTWMWLSDSRLRELPFFRWVFGTIELRKNLRDLSVWLAAYVATFLPLILIGRSLRPRGRSFAVAISLAAAAVVATPLIVWFRAVPWKGIIRPLPIFLTAIAIVLLARFIRRRRRRAISTADGLALTLTLFALGLLAKMLFNVLTFHYGFALAMPGTMILIALLVCWIPRWVDQHNGTGWLPRAAAAAAIIVAMGAHVYTSARSLERRIYPFGTGADRFFIDADTRELESARQDLLVLARPGDTLIAMPEGAILNYLLRLRSTSRYQNFLPSEMMMYGERQMLDELKQRPPTFVALVHRASAEYDAAFFGRDYAREIFGWLSENYAAVRLEGALPFRGTDFGVLLLQHRRSSATDDSR